MKKQYTARADDKIVEIACEIWPGSFNSLVGKLLEDYVVANRPSLEILLAREEELENEIKKVREQIALEQQRLSGAKTVKKAVTTPEKEETPLESVKRAIMRQLQNTSIKTIIESTYFKAFQKKLGWSEQQVIDLILSMATEDKKQEYVMSCDVTSPSTQR